MKRFSVAGGRSTDTEQRPHSIFWKRLHNSGNSLLNSLSSICRGNMTSLAAKCDNCSPLPSTPDFEIKLHIWKSFEKTVVNWCMHHDFIRSVTCFIVSNIFVYISF